MFNRLLVPLDGSRLAESVIPIVRRMAQLVPCSIILLHVIEKNAPSTIHGDLHLHNAEQAEVYLASIAAAFKSEGLETSTHVHTVPQGDVSKCIAEHAAELERDLVVLCSHGEGGFRRFVFGSNAEHVLSHGSTPVLFVPADEHGLAPTFGPERILVLLDSTGATLPAFETGSTLAMLANARLHLLAAVPTMLSIKAEEAATGRLVPGTTRELLEMAAEEIAAYIQGQMRDLASQGVSVTGKVQRGDTATAVLAEAEATRSDLVVLAVRRLAGLSAFWAGAFTWKIAGAFHGALLLLPRAGD